MIRGQKIEVAVRHSKATFKYTYEPVLRYVWQVKVHTDGYFHLARIEGWRILKQPCL